MILPNKRVSARESAQKSVASIAHDVKLCEFLYIIVMYWGLLSSFIIIILQVLPINFSSRSQLGLGSSPFITFSIYSIWRDKDTQKVKNN